MSTPDVTVIVIGLARYLRDHPKACDGLDGIARWWFDPQQDIDKEKLEIVLQTLTRRGALEALAVGDRTCWRLVDSTAMDAAVSDWQAGRASG